MRQLTDSDLRQIESIIEKMSLDELIGGCCTFEFCGTSVGDDAITAIKDLNCAGLRITPHVYSAVGYLQRYSGEQRISPYATPAEYTKVLNRLQKMAIERPTGIPLHFCSDSEGDLSADYARGGVQLATSSMGLTATNDEDLVKRASYAVAFQNRAAGIQWLHTPCCDVNVEPENPEICTRSFSDDPNICAKFVKAQIEGYREANVIATAKHFPGRGDSKVDAHFSLSRNDHPMERLEKIELVPFKAAIDAGVPAVMTSHNIYGQIDPKWPTSVSSLVVKGLLRDKLGFEGVITTDAMGMKGVIDMFNDFGEACAQAILAGNDLVLAKADPKEWPGVVKSIKKLVDQGALTKEDLIVRNRRILKLKMMYGLFDNPFADPKQAQDSVKRDDIVKACRENAEKALICTRKEENIIPLDTSKKVLCIDQFYRIFHMKAEDVFYHSHMLPEFVRKHADKVIDYQTKLDPTKEDKEMCLELAKEADVIIALSFFWRGNPTNSELIKELIKTGKPVILISNSPYKNIIINEARNVVVTFGAIPNSLRAAVDFIYGKIEANGMWPLKNTPIPK